MLYGNFFLPQNKKVYLQHFFHAWFIFHAILRKNSEICTPNSDFLTILPFFPLAILFFVFWHGVNLISLLVNVLIPLQSTGMNRHVRLTPDGDVSAFQCHGDVDPLPRRGPEQTMSVRGPAESDSLTLPWNQKRPRAAVMTVTVCVCSTLPETRNKRNQRPKRTACVLTAEGRDPSGKRSPVRPALNLLTIPQIMCVFELLFYRNEQNLVTWCQIDIYTWLG